MTQIFVSQFLQEQWAYACAYVHLVSGLVGWLLEKRAIVAALPDDVLAVTFRVPVEWLPILVEECADPHLTDDFLAGNDTLLIAAEQFPFPDGALPSWSQVVVTKAGVTWGMDVDGGWLETYELPWQDLEVSRD